jgi:uncharacterized beta-barrel protein YwiB (DUF1934 family)
MNGKSAKIKINSYIDNLDCNGLPEGEPEVTESTLEGAVFCHPDGGVTITYAEGGEGGEVNTEVKISEGEARVIRRGAIESVMIFREDEPYKTLYRLPPYSFDMEIVTKRRILTKSESGVRLRLVYSMSVGGALRLCRMEIEAKYN